MKSLCVTIASLLIAALLMPTAHAAPAGPTVRSATNAYRPCSTSGTETLDDPTLLLSAAGVDPTDPIEGDYFDFELWPMDDPAQVSTYSTIAGGGPTGLIGNVSVPDGTVVDGTVYAWHARIRGESTSPWFTTCIFRVDSVPPAAAPTVTLTNPGDAGTQPPPGQPYVYRFDARGDPDVVGFKYDWGVQDVWSAARRWDQNADAVRATAPGGTAVVTTNPPNGFSQLSVWSVDRAGNLSPVTTLQTGPSFNQAPWIDYAAGGCHLVKLRISRPAGAPTNTTAVRYSIGYGPWQQTALSPTGTVLLAVPVTGSVEFRVTLTAPNGYESTIAENTISIPPTPTVVSEQYPQRTTSGAPGTPGTFTVTAPLEQISYRFSDGVSGSLELNDYTTDLQWTPTSAGPASLRVYARQSVGTPASCAAVYNFSVGS